MTSQSSPGTEAGGLTLRAVGGRVRGPLAATYSLVLLEQVIAAAQPWVLGAAINGVIAGTSLQLVALGITSMAYMFVGTLRRAVDTRVYARLNAQLSRETALKLADSGASGASVITRTDLVSEFVEFFERFLPAAVQAGASMLGSLIALIVIDYRIAIVCATAMCPLAVVQIWYTRRSYALSIKLHDAMERRVHVLSENRFTGLRGVLERLRRLRVALSDAEAVCFSWIELFSLGVVLWAVVVLAGDDEATTGSVFAGLAYVSMVLGAVEIAPYILQQAARLREIGTRV